MLKGSAACHPCSVVQPLLCHAFCTVDRPAPPHPTPSHTEDTTACQLSRGTPCPQAASQRGGSHKQEWVNHPTPPSRQCSHPEREE